MTFYFYFFHADPDTELIGQEEQQFRRYNSRALFQKENEESRRGGTAWVSNLLEVAVSIVRDEAGRSTQSGRNGDPIIL